jgi:uncharacterized protein YndB with AHSA1/START domain
MPNSLIVHKSVTIDTAPAEVWEALTHSDWTRKYMFGCDVVSDWEVGEPIEFPDQHGVVQVKGKIVDFEFEKKLAFTVFGPNMGLADIPANHTTVTYELAHVDGGTRLSVLQGDFAGAERGEERYRETLASWEVVLNKLKEVLETI